MNIKTKVAPVTCTGHTLRVVEEITVPWLPWKLIHPSSNIKSLKNDQHLPSFLKKVRQPLCTQYVTVMHRKTRDSPDTVAGSTSRSISQ